MAGFDRGLAPSEEAAIAAVQAEVLRRARAFSAVDIAPAQVVEETDAIAYCEGMRMLVPTLTRTLSPEPAHIAEGLNSAQVFARVLQSEYLDRIARFLSRIGAAFRRFDD